MKKCSITINEELKRQFREEGYFILKRIIPDEHLALLRNECELFVNRMDTQLENAGSRSHGLTHYRRRYFISGRYHESRKLHEFIFSPLMAEICKATIGNDAFLVHEQWVVKSPEKDSEFPWHQDSGYGLFPHTPYITCWCALDDMGEENGTVSLLPYSQVPESKNGVLNHVRLEGSSELGDLVAYEDDKTGISVNVPAGSIAVFSTLVLHRSGCNKSSNWRRVYIPNYSAAPLRNPTNGKTGGTWAVRFLASGNIVYDGVIPKHNLFCEDKNT